MAKIGIYEIRNLIDNKVYIGSSKSTNRRFTIHKHKLNKNIHDNKHLQFAWNKYGATAFEFKIIQAIENEADLLKYEQMWIDWTKCYDENLGYNINKIAGSNLGYKHTEAHKAKISKIHKGKIVSDISKIKMKANSKIRNKEKWPHELGRKCQCKECRTKKIKYHTQWKRNKRIKLKEIQNV